MMPQQNRRTINDVFQAHALCQIEQHVRKQHVIAAFSPYVNEKTFRQWHLSLYRFASVRPLMYINHQAVQTAYAFFSQHAQLTVQALTSLQTSTTHAIFSLLREGKSWNREKPLELGDPEHILDFENVWHPEYQRYCEHILNHLIRIPLFIIGSLKGKDYQAPALSTRIGVLSSHGLATLTEGFHAIVRNAISHGATTFNLFDITYMDSGSTESLTASGFSFLFDCLVDTCHAIVVALLLFLCDHQQLIAISNRANLPLGLRFLFIDAFASHRGLQPVAMIESIALQGRSQLNIVCTIDTRSRNLQLHEALNICWNTCLFGGENYDRFGVSFRCGTVSKPFIFINGQKLREAIHTNAVAEMCLPSLIESDMLWFKAPKASEKMFIWKNILVPQWESSKVQFMRELQSKGFKFVSSQYIIRDVENRSAGSLRRIVAHVVLREESLLLGEYCAVVKSAIKKLHAHMVRISDLQQEIGWLGRPHYIVIRLYAHDRRIRTLASSGWNDENLLIMAEWFSRQKNNGPIFVKHPDLLDGGIRIRYSPMIHRTAQQKLLTVLVERIKSTREE
jgi:hypothetical protein